MGDRGNVVIVAGEVPPIYLYTHWDGTELPGILADALGRRLRWTDDSYLARIIFDEMTKGRQGEETGYGISAYMTDNEHPLLVVDVDRQEVRVIDSDAVVFDPHAGIAFSFTDYVEAFSGAQFSYGDDGIEYVSALR